MDLLQENMERGEARGGSGACPSTNEQRSLFPKDLQPEGCLLHADKVARFFNNKILSQGRHKILG
jgi:hypothetical protein